MEERQLSLSEVAHRMGKSERTIRRWIKAGKLKAYKPGRDYLIPESAIQELVERSEVYPKLQAPLPDFELEQERRYERLGDEQLAFSLNYERRVMETHIKSYRGFIEDQVRREEPPNYEPDIILGNALFHSIARVKQYTNLLSEANRVLAARSGEGVTAQLRVEAEKFIETFQQLGEVKEELAQAQARLQGRDLGPGDPAGIFDHSVGPHIGDETEAWLATELEQGEAPVKERDA